MKDRITQFLNKEGISPAEFAEKIGVQRSSVSHVLNGRNYPSASFIQKMLGSYRTLNPRWLLLGEGTISDTKSPQVKEPALFQFPDEDEVLKASEEIRTSQIVAKNTPVEPPDQLNNGYPTTNIQTQPAEVSSSKSLSELIDSSLFNKEVERIVLFYKDKTFAAYTPSK